MHADRGNFIGGHVAGRGVKTTLAATIVLFFVAVSLLPFVSHHENAAARGGIPSAV